MRSMSKILLLIFIIFAPQVSLSQNDLSPAEELLESNLKKLSQKSAYLFVLSVKLKPIMQETGNWYTIITNTDYYTLHTELDYAIKLIETFPHVKEDYAEAYYDILTKSIRTQKNLINFRLERLKRSWL